MLKLQRKFVVAITCMGLGIMVCVFAIWGCSVTTRRPNLSAAPNGHAIRFDVYNGAQIAKSGQLPCDSQIYAELRRLLDDDSAKWSKSCLTFAPGIAFRDDDYSVTMQAKILVLNYKKTDGSWTQITREITPNKYEAVRTALLNEK